MNIKEANERLPFLKGVLPVVPDDTEVYYDGAWGTVGLGLTLHIRTQISREVLESIKDGSLNFLPKDWYRRLHEELIHSEIEYHKKMAGVKQEEGKNEN